METQTQQFVHCIRVPQHAARRHAPLVTSFMIGRKDNRTTETKDKNPETIEVRVIKNEWN